MFAGIFGPYESVLTMDPMTLGILITAATVGHILGHFVLRVLQNVAEQPKAQKN
jgi:hypothetical protein